MESSQDEEECRSSESGWTMYLGSSMEEDSNGGVENDDEEEESDCDKVGSVHEGEEEEEDSDDGNEDDDNGNGRDGLDSDDSMASDASSRPCHQGFWAKSDDSSKQGKGSVQGRGRGRTNMKMGKK